MTQQPSLFSQETSVSPQIPEAQSDSPNARSNGIMPDGCVQPPPPQAPLWLQFLELSVRVVVRIYLGLLLVALPWTHYWSNNGLLLMFPHLAAIALSGAARGIVSGLGLLNIWIGIHDALHYNEK